MLREVPRRPRGTIEITLSTPNIVPAPANTVPIPLALLGAWSVAIVPGVVDHSAFAAMVGKDWLHPTHAYRTWIA
jgi:hypothetical protein